MQIDKNVENKKHFRIMPSANRNLRNEIIYGIEFSLLLKTQRIEVNSNVRMAEL